jgi:hypothetical protein
MFGFSTVGDLVAAAITGGFAQNTQLPGFFDGGRLFQYNLNHCHSERNKVERRI